ncbi:universal stress protein, partial [Kitasatospora aureofaciens]|uniref:universal stress protein n=1 Tax=Kitasatospora aureofaciens TaxID=1894 RepID=UPI000525A70E
PGTATRSGRLRVYLGSAPGVGKTYRMLDEARRRQERGADVVVGYIETHGRQHTRRMLEGLEVLPRVHRSYRGAEFEEMDLDAVLARRPSVVLVDELAHTNIPGGRHAKRWQDVEELLDYFRVGNLTALRELALLWVAGRVDEGLRDYRADHCIDRVWETRERVVVALTGGPEGETIIRRAARIADRTAGGDLLAVHVSRSDGLAGASSGALAQQRQLVEALGGSYHVVVGDDVPTALLAFARAHDATQLVLGTSRR